MLGDFNSDMFNEFFQGLLEDVPDDVTMGQLVEQMGQMGVKEFVKTFQSMQGMFFGDAS